MPSGAAPVAPARPQSARQPFDRAMWLERYRVNREAEYASRNFKELLLVSPLMSPRHRPTNLATSYEHTVAAMHATRKGGATFFNWQLAHQLGDPQKFTRRETPKVPLLRLSTQQRAQSAKSPRREQPAVAIPLDKRREIPALDAPHLLHHLRGTPGATLKKPPSARMVREQQMLAYRGAPTLDKDFMNWWMREDSYDDDRPDAAVTEIEIRAALRIIRKKLMVRVASCPVFSRLAASCSWLLAAFFRPVVEFSFHLLFWLVLFKAS